MENFNELLAGAGFEMPAALGDPIQNEGVSFYEHPVGDYKALVGKVEVTYKDADNKKCDPTKPGAKAINAGLKLIIIQDTEKVILDLKSFKFADGIEYGRKFYNQYISFDGTKQWQNVRLFKDFVFDGIPESAVIQGEKNQELVYLKNLPLFVCVPVSFTLEAGTKGARYIKADTLKLLDKNFTKEKFIGRKNVFDIIQKQLEEELKEMRAKSAKNKAAGQSAPEVKNENPDDFLGGILNQS